MMSNVKLEEMPVVLEVLRSKEEPLRPRLLTSEKLSLP